jgi:hypothetical protein
MLIPFLSIGKIRPGDKAYHNGSCTVIGDEIPQNISFIERNGKLYQVLIPDDSPQYSIHKRIRKNDADNNKKQMLNFIENNFTYRDESGENHLITNLYKEFSYLDNIAHKRRQISIISKLISELQQELLKLKS